MAEKKTLEDWLDSPSILLDLPATEMPTQLQRYNVHQTSFVVAQQDLVSEQIKGIPIKVETPPAVIEKMFELAVFLVDENREHNNSFTYRSQIDDRSGVDVRLRDTLNDYSITLLPTRGYPKGFPMKGGVLDKSIPKDQKIDDYYHQLAKHYSGKKKDTGDYIYDIYPTGKVRSDWARVLKANAFRLLFGNHPSRLDPVKYVLTWNPNSDAINLPLGFILSRGVYVYNKIAEDDDRLNQIEVINFFDEDTLDEKIAQIMAINRR